MERWNVVGEGMTYRRKDPNGEFYKVEDVDKEFNRLKQENESLEKNISNQRESILKLHGEKAKLIEALKSLENLCIMNGPMFDQDIKDFEIIVKASQTMKEVCGEEKKS